MFDLWGVQTVSRKFFAMVHIPVSRSTLVVFACMCMGNPNLLLLDEPTNHLDIEAIDSLADAINAFKGGVVLVSHDFRLIDQVAKEIWVCENWKVTPWKQDIRSYKKLLAKKVMGDKA